MKQSVNQSDKQSDNQKKNDFSRGSVVGNIMKLAVPMTLAQLINVLYNIVDRIYIGMIPENATLSLTGLGLCLPIISIVIAFANLFGMGGAPLCSIERGRGNEKEAEAIMGNSFVMMVAVGILLTVLGLMFKRPMLYLFGASDATIPYADAYVTIYLMGNIFVMTGLGMNSFINSQGFGTVGMMTVLLGAVTNIVLDPVFIFVFNMGGRGAALATIISQGISAAWVVLFLVSNKSYLKIRTCFMRPKREILMPAIALGAAPFVMQFTESILNICFNTSLLKYGGDVAVGAMTIMGSVMQFSLLPLQGLTQGAQPIISFNYGAKKLDRVSRTFRLLLTSCMTYSTVLWAVAMFAPMVYIRIFTQDAALTAFSEWSIRIYMAASLLFGAQLACQQTFIAIGDSKTSLFLALLRKVILLIPLIYILPNIFENKVFAVFVAEPIADTIAVCTTVTLFILSFRKMKRELGANA